MSPLPGEVWLADLGMAAKTRPVVVVSRRDEQAPRALAIYVPLTTQNRGSRYEVVIPRLSFLRQVPGGERRRPRHRVDGGRSQADRRGGSQGGRGGAALSRSDDGVG